MRQAVLPIVGLLLSGCGAAPADVRPAVAFTRVPEAAEGGPDRVAVIEGRVTGAAAGQRIVLFARSGQWWVQPLADAPFTSLRPDGSWSSETHLGTEYAALLVRPGYEPPATTDTLPATAGAVLAVATVAGTKGPGVHVQTLQFSGYEWQVRTVPSPRGGGSNAYDAANAWTDAKGFLHLRIAKRGEAWANAEINLTRSLGYGAYRFVVREVSHLEPAAVLSLFTWDTAGTDPNHREMGIEISRWGDASNKNAQFVVQPYYIPANAARFDTLAGRTTYELRWEPGRAAFKAVRGAGGGAGARIIAEHAFTSGVPSTGSESIRMNLYVFPHSRIPLTRETEVVIEKFEYLP